MAQTTLIAPATTAATSADFTVPANESVLLVAYTATGDFSQMFSIQLFHVIGAVDQVIKENGIARHLSNLNNSMLLHGPGTFLVKKLVTDEAIGVVLNDAT